MFYHYGAPRARAAPMHLQRLVTRGAIATSCCAFYWSKLWAFPPIGHGASPRPPPAEVPRLAQAQPAAQPTGQPSSPEKPRGRVGSGQLLQTPSPPDCGRPAHDSGSPRPCRVSADGGARGAARRGSFASRVDAAEAHNCSRCWGRVVRVVGGIRRAQTRRPPPRWLRIPPRRLQQPWWPAHAPSGVGALPTTLLYAQPLSRGAALAPTVLSPVRTRRST